MKHVSPVGVMIAAGLAAASPPVITYRNTVNLPATTTDQNGAPFTITGLSGISWRGGDEFVAVMDNSNKLVRLSVQFSANAAVSQASVVGGISLAESHDMEGVAVSSAANAAYIAEEDSPAVRVFSLIDGLAGAPLSTPAVFLNRRSNLGFESLVRSADGSTIWTANEAALTVDGPTATSGAGTTVRLLRFDQAGGAYQPSAQFAYNAEPLHGAAISGSVSGVSDLVILPDGRLIVLERSLAFSINGIFLTRIYLVDSAGANDVSALPGLIGQSFTPVAKTLLYSGSHTNLEGLCLGPQLATGSYALLGIVDDGDPVSVNALVALEISGVGVAPCYANCDSSTTPPALNVADFTCFLQKYASGDPYANCDASTQIPTLNVADFTCFLQQYATGCP